MSIPDHIREQVLATLAELERDHEVRVLYACESGSRAWGFASQDSDFDIRFIYAHTHEHYLKLNRGRDVIELPISDELDVSGWDLYKACELLRKSNPPLLEWLDSPIVYREDEGFAESLRDVSAPNFSLRACGEHYMSMARSNYKAYIADRDRVVRKKYLYALRPIVATTHLLERRSFPPTDFNTARARVELSEGVETAIGRLIEAKSAGGELGEAPADPLLSDFISRQVVELSERVGGLPGRAFDTTGLDRLIREVVLESSP